MSINWLDFVLAAILIAAVIIEWRRGFGRAIFDLAGVILVFIAAKLLFGNVAGVVHPFSSPEANESFAFSLIIVPGMVIFLIVADLAYNCLLFSADVFERVLGILCGFAIGLAVAHSLAFAIWLGTGRNDDRANLFTNSAISGQILTFQSYHNSMEWLTQLGQERKKEPLP